MNEFQTKAGLDKEVSLYYLQSEKPLACFRAP